MAAKVSKLFAAGWAGLAGVVLVGCAQTAKKVELPVAPMAPLTRVQTVEEALDLGAVTGGGSWVNEAKSFGVDAIGVFEFKGGLGAPQVAAGVAGRLSDMAMFRRVKVVDRGQISRAVEALRRDDEIRYAGMTEAKKADVIGRQLGVGYLLFGEVTRYDSEDRSVALKTVFADQERERYGKDYARFQEILTKRVERLRSERSAESGSSGDLLKRIEDLRSQVQPLDDYEQQVLGRQESRSVTVYTVGVDAKLIEVSTGKHAWFFHAETKDLDALQAMNRLSHGLVDSLLEGTK
jgi:hypothetical protein